MCWVLIVGYMPNAITWATNVRIWTPPFCKQAVMTDKARLRTYIRPLKLAYVDAGP